VPFRHAASATNFDLRLTNVRTAEVGGAARPFAPGSRWGVAKHRQRLRFATGGDRRRRPTAQPLPRHRSSRGRAERRDRISHTRRCASTDAQEESVMTFINYLRTFAKDESGQDLLEYALLVALIALVAFGAVKMAGTSVNTIFGNIASQLSSAT
jgi:pilus assembly protein Flp/PilA